MGIDIKLLIDDVDSNEKELNNTKLALYNQLGELTEDQAQEILNYINYIKSKK